MTKQTSSTTTKTSKGKKLRKQLWRKRKAEALKDEVVARQKENKIVLNKDIVGVFCDYSNSKEHMKYFGKVEVVKARLTKFGIHYCASGTFGGKLEAVIPHVFTITQRRREAEEEAKKAAEYPGGAEEYAKFVADFYEREGFNDGTFDSWW